MNADSRYDSYAAHAAWVRRHVHTCRDESCTFEEELAEDRARDREAS